VAVLLAAVLAVLLLAGCGGEDPPSPSAASPAPSPPSSPSPSAGTVAPATPSAAVSLAPAGDQVVLGGVELGVTRLGEPFREAVRDLNAVLGQPDADPSEAVTCIPSETEVRWGEFVVAAEKGRLAGWSSASPTLRTPSGVTVGTTSAELDRIYGPDLQRFPANPDNPPTFAVQGVDVFGSLSSEGADARVSSLFSGFCSGP